MSSLIRCYARDILAEINHSALQAAVGKTKRHITYQGSALGVAALLFWATAMLIGQTHHAASLIFLMLSFGVTCAMLQSVSSQIALGRTISKDIQ